jgi:16S rRNA (guanine1207-N2)-methyltransferase
MSTRASPQPPATDYHTWRSRSVKIDGVAYALATKPGLVAHGRDDAAARLLAELVVVPEGATVVQMQCGSALFGAVAARGHGAARVHLTDRSAVGVEAAARTMQLNGITTADVHAGHGSKPLDPALQADVVAIRIPTEKLALLQLMVDAFRLLRIGGSCTIAGATNEGIKSAAALLRELFGNATVLGTDSGHRAVMATKRTRVPAEPLAFANPFLDHQTFHPLPVTLRGVPLQLYSRPGVFSWEHLDEGTAVLADTLDVREGDSVLELGCGSGGLGLLAATLSKSGPVTMLDVDAEAIRCARGGVEVAGRGAQCRVELSDVASAVLDQRFDLVIANPPFHVGKNTDLEVPAQFIRDAWQVLKPGGRVQLVANRTLPYERIVFDTFGNLTTQHDGPRFKVLAAVR